jgi:hypothetical protein
MKAEDVATGFQVVNAALELITAGALVMSRLNALQQARDAAGAPLQPADLMRLMDSGDVQAALERAKIAQAVLAQSGSMSST